MPYDPGIDDLASRLAELEAQVAQLSDRDEPQQGQQSEYVPSDQGEDMLREWQQQDQQADIDRAIESKTSDTRQKVQKLRYEVDELLRRRQTLADSSTASTSVELVAMTTDDGTGTATATYTYAFTLADGTSQATISPSNARAGVDLLAATYGLWCVDALGAGKLIALFEWPDYTTCDTGMDGGSA